MRRQHEAAIAEFERAAALNPNFTNWRFPFTLVLAGEPSRAIKALDAHMRLDPFYEPYAPGAMGFAYHMLERYAEALPHLRECASRAPNMRLARLWLAATYVRLGEIDNARAETDVVLRIDPSYTIDAQPGCLFPSSIHAHAEHFFDSLRKAGVPEG